MDEEQKHNPGEPEFGEHSDEAEHNPGEPEFGEVRLTILETPGHTPEGISILVYDTAQSADQPPSRTESTGSARS